MQFTLYINRRHSGRIASAHTDSFGGQKTKTDSLLQIYKFQTAVFYPEIILVANNHDSVPSRHQSGWGGKFGLASCVPGCRAHNATPLHPVMCIENIMVTDVCSVQCGDRDLISGVCGT